MSVKCTHHCRSCESHFHSLQAFDAHFEREGEDGPALGCLAPDRDDEITGTFIGYAGVCRISHSVEELGTVWELLSRRGNVERAAA